MIADTLLFAAYLLVCLTFASRESLAALCVFFFAFFIGSAASSFEPWSYYALNVLLYGCLALCANDSVVKKASMLIVIFQYVMAWDAALFSDTATLLYSLYPSISALLNIILIITICKAGSKDVRRNRTLFRSPFDRILDI